MIKKMKLTSENKPIDKLLEVNGLSIQALHPVRKNLVHNISFDIEASETVALVGESGSGKSLTAFSLFGLQPNDIKISNGSVTFEGEIVYPSTKATIRALCQFSVGFVFQEAQSSLNPVVSIGKQIVEVVKNSGTENTNISQQKQKAINLLDEVEIDDPERVYNLFPHQLSGGMKQRVMIAIALAKNPRLLIADEPTTALDVSVQAKILKLIRQIQVKSGMGVLFITHDLAVAFEIADRIMVMKEGQIIDCTSSKSFSSTKPSEYAKKLISSLPSWSKRVSEGRTNFQDSEESILRVNNLSVSFQLKKNHIFSRRNFFKAIENVTFTLQKGRTLAVVGESGSGKTTLAKTILGLCSAELSGNITYQDTNILNCSSRDLKKIRGSLQIVFQDPISSLNPRLRIGEIIREGIDIHEPKQNDKLVLKKVNALLNDVGVPSDSMYRFPHEFSGGQRQRICIARALALEPEVIICDEPTSSLDVLIQSQIIDLLKQLQKNKGISYLFITHDINLVSYFADEVLVLRKGKLIEYGEVHEVVMKANNPYTQSLLAAAPKVPEDVIKNLL